MSQYWKKKYPKTNFCETWIKSLIRGNYFFLSFLLNVPQNVLSSFFFFEEEENCNVSTLFRMAASHDMKQFWHENNMRSFWFLTNKNVIHVTCILNDYWCIKTTAFEGYNCLTLGRTYDKKKKKMECLKNFFSGFGFCSIWISFIAKPPQQTHTDCLIDAIIKSVLTLCLIVDDDTT